MTAPTHSPDASQQDQTPAPATDAPTTDTGTPASSFGLLEDGTFVAKLGSGLRIQTNGESAEVDLSELRQPIPGIRFKSARLSTRASTLALKAELNLPNVAEGEFTINVNAEGQASLAGRLTRDFDLPALGNPSLTVELDSEGNFSGSASVEGADLLPANLRRSATASGSGTINFASGTLSGGGDVSFTYADLGSGRVNFSFSESGALTASGNITITPPFMEEISAEVGIDAEKNITASTTFSIGEMSTPIQGLSLGGGSLTLSYENGLPSASLADFTASYQGLGSVTVATASLDNSAKFAGEGSFALTLPGLSDTSGTVNIRNGAVSGTLRIAAEDFPEGLPVTNGAITVTLGESGALGFDGTVGVDLGPAGSGALSASYSETGEFSMGAEVDLTIPGLQGAHVSINYVNGDIEGEVQVPINTEMLPGLDGSVTVRYAQNRWSGETEMHFEADNGKLSGNIRITVAQNEENQLEIGGGGDVTVQLMPRLQGTLGAEILPEGGMDISGAIEVTEPLELFPEWRDDRELFRHSQNIPLWAMLVAVIRIRAGVRAGIGPGVFRNIRVEGSYTIGQEDADPSFSISGELFIPAFVEGYVAFGAGLGLDVLLGSLTGGIEGVATAGLYGAISVVPELSYSDGDWGIEGTATMAAGARLKLGLNAWAEIEALWITVWEQEWELAEHVMSVGPDLALQANMNYQFGQPDPPTIEMTTSDIDSESLIQEAMPEDGPAGSGARDALENRAEWQGALREQREAPVPPEVAAQAQNSETPPEPAPRPNRTGTPPAGANGQNADQAGANPENAQARSDATDAAASTDSSVQGAVPEDQAANNDGDRYGGPLSLDTLRGPPVPLPRTRAQEQQDVQAAFTVLRLASAQAGDSDTLDEYFPQIKERFKLASLGYEGDFVNGFKIVGKINPEFEFRPNEPLRGTDLPGDLSSRHVTNVEWTTTALGGSEVGTSMVAMPLGPDHPSGSGPQSGVQSDLMGQLATDPSLPSEKKYIRGHLLNDHLGGPGTERNMYPITGKANSQHLHQIEKYIKDWVNNDRFWVKYEVNVTGDRRLRTRNNQKYVNANFVASVAVLDTELDEVSALKKSVTIVSRYESAEETTGDTGAPDAEFERNLQEHANSEVRQADLDAEINESSTHSTAAPATFPRIIEDDLTSALAKNGATRSTVSDKLKSHSGFGAASATVLWKVYDKAFGKTDRDVTLESSEKATLTRIKRAWSSLSGLL